MQWLNDLVEWIRSIVIASGPFVQDMWAAFLDVLGMVVENPEPVAIGLGSMIGVILIGWFGGRAVMNYHDRRSSRRLDSLIGVDTEDESYDSHPYASERDEVDSDRHYRIQ